MLRPAMNQIATHGESYYSIVIGVAKRAREIADELSENNQTLEEKPVKTAVDEFAARRFSIVEDPALRSSEGTV
ncbi:MAG: DNA-directed RNA polymerase subunit omega [Oscillospiraceae bacterium]|nr:DNA-directed RNA polymerase subunit omega [Oscillospiraceae bacterium]